MPWIIHDEVKPQMEYLIELVLQFQFWFSVEKFRRVLFGIPFLYKYGLLRKISIFFIMFINFLWQEVCL